ncbi:MAG: hypothetical protein NVS3B17_07940 [Vulcanimicrobiaceae bacterium]
MKEAASARAFAQARDLADVIDVRVRVHQQRRADAEGVETRDDAVDLGATVDDDRFAAAAVGDDRAGAREGADRKMLDDDAARWRRYGIAHPKSR